jgi:hypothetical protein
VPIFTDITTGNVIESPIINISTARAVVSVPNGQTIVMGGMITKSDESIERKVPFLGDVPLLGLAFRYDGVTTRRTELLIFLTPRVIRHDEDSELIKRVEAERVHFIEREAEEIHGPLYAVPPGSGWDGPEACPPGIQFQDSFELPPAPAPGPVLQGELPQDDPNVPTTVMPADTLPRPGPVTPESIPGPTLEGVPPPQPQVPSPPPPQPMPPQPMPPPQVQPAAPAAEPAALPADAAAAAVIPGRAQLTPAEPPPKKKKGLRLLGGLRD